MSQETSAELSTQVIQSVLGSQKEAFTPAFNKKPENNLLASLASSMRLDTARPRGYDYQLSESLTNNVRRLDVAKRNLGDGMDMLMTADGALSKIQSNLERMKELASEASNPLYNREARERLQKEADFLAQEISVIEESAEFKGQKLLNQDTAALTLQVGYQAYQTSRMTIGFDQGILGRLEQTPETTTPVITPVTPTDPQTDTSSGRQTDTGGTSDNLTDPVTEPDPGTGGDTGTTDPVDTGGSGGAGDGSGGAAEPDNTTTDPVTSPETPPVAVAELASNAEIAAAFGWEVDSEGKIYTGQATAAALSEFWSGMTQSTGGSSGGGNGQGNGKGKNKQADSEPQASSLNNITATDKLKAYLDLDVEDGLHHQTISKTFDINGTNVEYQFKVSFIVGTNSRGEKEVLDVKPTMSNEDQWQNGSPINVVLGDQQVAVRFNRNLNQNQTQNYNYLENSDPGGFQNFGILTSDFRPLTVENIQETATPPVEVAPPSATDPEQPAEPVQPTEPPVTDSETGTGSDGSGSSGSGAGTGGSSDADPSAGGQSGNAGSGHAGTGGTGSGKTLLETLLSGEAGSSIQVVNLTDSQSAESAVQSTAEAIDFVKNMRADLEASARELGAIMSGHEVHSRALTESSGRIQDAASAQQAAYFTQQQILEQTSLAVSGMANTDNRAVLSLLKGPEPSVSEIPYHFPPEEKAQDKQQPLQAVSQSGAEKQSADDEEEQQPLYEYPREEEEQSSVLAFMDQSKEADDEEPEQKSDRPEAASAA